MHEQIVPVRDSDAARRGTVRLKRREFADDSVFLLIFAVHQMKLKCRRL